MVEYGSPKTHQQRTVPIPVVLLEPLPRRCARKGPNDLLLTSPEGGVLRSGDFRRRVFDPAVRESGLSGLTPHELRDTAASLPGSPGPTSRPSSASSGTPPPR
ncbi:MAG: Phage integrase [Blastococcus sp.]|nr:Phage integrase [Blastococcus sp.]